MSNFKDRPVRREDFGDAWPLTVSGGTVRVTDRHTVTFLTLDAREFALNGAAKVRGYSSIEPIWATSDTGARRSLGPLLSFALG